VVLNANTGLIGMPQQTIGAGVNVKCLINSRIHLNGLIQLDQASVYRSALSADQIAQAGGQFGGKPKRKPCHYWINAESGEHCYGWYL
jgi:hypothetical protein